MPRISKGLPPGWTSAYSTDDIWQNTLRSQLCADIDGVFERRHEQLREQLNSWMASQEKKVDDLVAQLMNAITAWTVPELKIPHKEPLQSNGDIDHAGTTSTASAASFAFQRASTSRSSGVDSAYDDLVQSKSQVDKRRQSRAEAIADETRRSIHIDQVEDFTRQQSGLGKALQGRLQKIVRHKNFDLLFATVIICNAAFLGVQLEYKANVPDERNHVWLVVMQYCFSFLFLVELLFRISASGTEFICSKDWNWNLFDFTVVVLSIVEVAVQVVSQSQSDTLKNFSLLRILRAVRVIRILRVLKLFKFFRSLRVMIHAIFHTLKLCTWALVLLAMLLYMFGIYFTQAVNENLRDDLQAAEGALRYFYGSLGRTIFTLFKSTCGGLSWQDAVEPLASVSWFCVFLFVVYISFVYFAVLNVVTGIFCHSALESSNWDTDEVVAEQMHEKDKYVQRLHEVFNDLTDSSARGITINDFQAHLHEPRARALFKILDIETSDAWTIFNLLDADGGGIVDIDEFVEGCVQMKGSAKSIHIHQMMHENKWIMKRLHYMTKMLEVILKPERAKNVRRSCSVEIPNNDVGDARPPPVSKPKSMSAHPSPAS